MKTTAERIDGCQVVLNIEVEPEELESSSNQAYHRMASGVTIPGFRKGKAPRHLVERYLGEEALLEDAMDHLFPVLYERAIEEQGIDAIASPQVELTQLDPVVFKVTIPTRPIVELGNYRELKIAPKPVEITVDEIEGALDRLRHLHALWQPAARPVHLGDLVAIDIEGQVGDKIVLSEKGRWYYLSPDSSLPVPGFAEQLVGMEKDEEREFALVFPPDHPSTELAGRECIFRVSVSEVKEEHLPELDDEFAKALGQGVESVDLLRERIEAELKKTKEAQARMGLEEEAVDAVVAMSHIDYPSILVERELERLVAEHRERLGGQQGFETQLRLSGKTEEEFRKELHLMAERLVRRSLVLDKVREAEGIEVSDVEIDAEVERLAQGAGEDGKQVQQLFSSPPARDSLKRELLIRKTIQHLVEITTT